MKFIGGCRLFWRSRAPRYLDREAAFFFSIMTHFLWCNPSRQSDRYLYNIGIAPKDELLPPLSYSRPLHSSEVLLGARMVMKTQFFPRPFIFRYFFLMFFFSFFPFVKHLPLLRLIILHGKVVFLLSSTRRSIIRRVI